MRDRRIVLLASIGSACAVAGCLGPGPRPVQVDPLTDTQLMIHMGPQIGRVRLWVPEGIMSEQGAASIYPKAEGWVWDGSAWCQRVGPQGLFGGGNAGVVDERTVQCAGVEMTRESEVICDTRVQPLPDGVEFFLVLTNAGARPIRKAGAAICAKLADAAWWRDDRVFVPSGGQWRTLADLGRSAGRDDVFEAYLLAGASFDNVFYHQFWGVSPHRLDAPLMIVERASESSDGTGDCLCGMGIGGEQAYFLHSNRENPCADIMLAFGDLEPGQTAAAHGRLWFGRSACIAGTWIPKDR